MTEREKLQALLAGLAEIPVDPESLARLIDAASTSEYLALFSLVESGVFDPERFDRIWGEAQTLAATMKGVTRRA